MGACPDLLSNPASSWFTRPQGQVRPRRSARQTVATEGCAFVLTKRDDGLRAVTRTFRASRSLGELREH